MLIDHQVCVAKLSPITLQRGRLSCRWCQARLTSAQHLATDAQEGTITWAKSAPTATIKKHMAALAKLAVKLDIPLVRVDQRTWYRNSAL